MNMSFMLTIPQMRSRTKTVTRRVGWWKLKPGAVINAIEKGQGLKKGEKIRHIHQIRIVSVRNEKLMAMLHNSDYGFDEVRKEGFANHPELKWPSCFVEMFCATHQCDSSTMVNRIEFEHL